MTRRPVTPEEIRAAVRAKMPDAWREAMDQRETEDRKRRGRGGRPPAEHPREARVTIRFTAAERAQLAQAAGEREVAEFIRAAALKRVPKLARQVPAVNGAAWAALAPVVANLNQLARHANEGRGIGRELAPALEDVRRHVMALRAALLGRDEPVS